MVLRGELKKVHLNVGDANDFWQNTSCFEFEIHESEKKKQKLHFYFARNFEFNCNLSLSVHHLVAEKSLQREMSTTINYARNATTKTRRRFSGVTFSYEEIFEVNGLFNIFNFSLFAYATRRRLLKIGSGKREEENFSKRGTRFRNLQI